MSDVDFSPWNGTMSSTGLKPKLQPTRTQSKFHVSNFMFQQSTNQILL
jgi:hypothetical protein